VRPFNPKIPLRGSIGVVNEHEMRVVFEPLRLSLHRLPILFDEFRKNKLQQPGAKGHPVEKVPAGDHIDAAVIAV